MSSVVDAIPLIIGVKLAMTSYKIKKPEMLLSFSYS